MASVAASVEAIAADTIVVATTVVGRKEASRTEDTDRMAALHRVQHSRARTALPIQLITALSTQHITAGKIPTLPGAAMPSGC